jgi:hypothetical protein
LLILMPLNLPPHLLKRSLILALAGCLACAGFLSCPAQTSADLASNFASPPDSARPWVYWFWVNNNVTKKGITADLEAMQRVGIGGVLIMAVDVGAPKGPVTFGTPEWNDLFKFSCQEAARLGLSINMNNDAGWCGSGGPWITPALSMQRLVYTETPVHGPQHFEETLAQPEAVNGYYEDIAVQAYPTPSGDFKIDNLKGKTALDETGWRQLPPAAATYPKLHDDQAINPAQIVDLTESFKQGKLTWDVPEGNWTIVRYGHTTNGVENHPAPEGGLGLESDKLSAEATEAMYDGLMKKLVGDIGPLAGQTLVTTHIDSWETGSQNWTPKFREEFQTLMGYDPQPFFPVLTGRVVQSLECSERFLWDWRQTVSSLLVKNYAGKMLELAQKDGLRLSIEGYDAPVNQITYAGQCTEPMGELWSWPRGWYTPQTMEMVSAAHVYGKPIVGLETFTADSNEKWLGHPGSVKSLGDLAFCYGINRFVFHRYAMQPWLNEKPGMSMGPFGLHYERTQTWWEQSKPWHEYLARCQYLLRQGLFVADLCYLEPEGAVQFHAPEHAPDAGYRYDGCSPDVVLTRMSVKDGWIVLPDGMSYRVLVLPDSQTMTPALAAKIGDLVEAGATVIGPRPVKSPSLAGYPDADGALDKIAQRVWGDCDGQKITEHPLGLGKVIWGRAPAKVLSDLGVPEDFVPGPETWGSLHFAHRQMADGTDLYFVANQNPQPVNTTCAFRVQGKRPELWWPQSGKIESLAAYKEEKGVTLVPLRLEGTESVFVVFRPGQETADPVVSITRDGKTLSQAVQPARRNIVVQKASFGVPGDPVRTRDIKARIQGLIDSAQVDLLVGTLASEDDPAPGTVKTLDVDYTVDGKLKTFIGHDPDTFRLKLSPSNIVVQKASYGVPGDPAHTRDVKARVQALIDGGQLDFTVGSFAEGDDPALGVVKTLKIDYAVEGKPKTVSGRDPDKISLEETGDTEAERTPDLRLTADGQWQFEAWKNGHYALTTAAGKIAKCDATGIPDQQDITGPWGLTFPANSGAPESVTLDQLLSWSNDNDPGVKYFSGTATYLKTFTIKSEVNPAKMRVDLDLGKVQVIAELKVNGKDMGILWKAPYRAEITDALKTGENTIEIKVTNLWVNRIIGDEQLPEDSDRNGDGTLKSWPQWVQDDGPSPTGRHTFTTWRLWSKDSPLQESGLLGPISLKYAARMTLQKP